MKYNVQYVTTICYIHFTRVLYFPILHFTRFYNSVEIYSNALCRKSDLDFSWKKYTILLAENIWQICNPFPWHMNCSYTALSMYSIAQIYPAIHIIRPSGACYLKISNHVQKWVRRENWSLDLYTTRYCTSFPAVSSTSCYLIYALLEFEIPLIPIFIPLALLTHFIFHSIPFIQHEHLFKFLKRTYKHSRNFNSVFQIFEVRN